MSRKLFVLSRAASFGGHESMLRRILVTAKKINAADPVVFCDPNSTLVGTEYPNLNVSRTRFKIVDVFKDVVRLKSIQRKNKSSQVLLSIGYLGEFLQIFVAGLFFGRELLVYCPIVDRFEDIGAKFGVIQNLIFKLIAKSIRCKWIFLAHEQELAFKLYFDRLASSSYIPNLIDSKFVQKNLGVMDYSKKEILNVLIVGRLDINQKGFDFVLDYISRSSESVRLTIIGKGPGEDFIREKSKLSLVSIELLPWQDLSGTLKDYDVLLIPSRFEGVPLVMLEAMFVGVPVVASDIPGHRAYLSEDMLFPIGDMANAFSIIKRLAENNTRNIVAIRNRVVYEQQCQVAIFEKSITKVLCGGEVRDA